ncbi:MAG: DinB family protein [Anaerolineae bacterium]|nr:DinB family protein [Anaerolineae bacterium]
MSDPQVLTTYRDGGTGWTALEALCHLRDLETIFTHRFTFTVEQDNPDLPMSNPDALATERRYNEQNVDQALAEWKQQRIKNVAYLKERSESDWERVGVHPIRGKMTLLDILCLEAQHDTIHMEQITRTLNEKKLPT